MLSLRSLARNAPRSICQAGLRTSLRQATFVARSPHLSLSRQAFARQWAAPFTVSARFRQDDQSLVVKLQEEIQVETDIKDPEAATEAIQEYMKRSPFEIKDVAGEEEVILTRKIGNENIRITFSVADVANHELEAEEDDAFADEDEFHSNAPNAARNINQGNPGNANVAPEDRVAQSDESAEHEDIPHDSFPARLNIIITKDSKKGALMIEAMAEDGQIGIENMYFFENKEFAEPKSFEQDWKRRGVYAGPPFGNLDEELQTLMDSYLAERGINDELALFIPDYIDYKEQKEYLRWLSNLKAFHE